MANAAVANRALVTCADTVAVTAMACVIRAVLRACADTVTRAASGLSAVIGNRLSSK